MTNLPYEPVVGSRNSIQTVRIVGWPLPSTPFAGSTSLGAKKSPQLFTQVHRSAIIHLNHVLTTYPLPLSTTSPSASV